MWWFAVPKVVFGEDALEELDMVEGSNAFIVTDEVINKLGYATIVGDHLTSNQWCVAIWDQAEADPRVSVVKSAADAMRSFGPDWIIAVGGGSVMDTAKAAWILYEHPEVELEAVNPLEPLNIRKKARMICIPTTAGTGSEATKAIVIREDETGRKFATTNPELVPDIAILDPRFVKKLPKELTAYTGMDALTHAVEGFVSGWKNDFSDACSMKAVKLVFEWLPKSMDDMSDIEAREKMQVAACLAGMSFSNSQVALAHSLGHCLGSVYRVQHGMAVGMALPYTIEFNQSEDAETAKMYQELGQLIGITESDPQKAALEFAGVIRELMKQIDTPTSLKKAGLSRKQFDEGLDKLIEFTMMDSSITMNPRFIDSEGLRKFYNYMYNGDPIDF